MTKPFGSGFAFGSSTNAAPSISFGGSVATATNPTSFAFGQSTDIAPTASASVPVPSPFAGFKFSKTTDLTVPTSPSAPVEQSRAKPFSGFGSSAQPTIPASDPITATSNPFGGFSFSAKPSIPKGEPLTSKGSEIPPAGIASASSTHSPVPSLKSQTGLSPSLPSPPPEHEVSYYTFLRGLNVSFLSFLSQTIDSNALIDLTQCLSGLLAQYQSHLDEAAAKSGWRPLGLLKPAMDDKSSKPSAADGMIQSPAPPSVGSFALLPRTTTSATTGGFVPTLTPTSSSSPASPFPFGNSGVPKASETTPAQAMMKPSAEVTELIEEVMADKPEQPKATDAPKPFSFTSLASTGTPEPKKTASLFAFGPPGPLHQKTPESQTFSPSSNVEAPSSPAGLGKFGPGGATPQLAFGGAKALGSGTPAVKHAFGSQTGFSFGSSVTVPGFSFGRTDDPNKAATKSSFSFGANPSDPAPKPIASAFAFGRRPSDDATNAPATGFMFGASAPSFAFGTPTNSAGPSTKPSAQNSAEATPEPTEPSKNLAEAVGAGEENEDTVIEQRGKLFHLEEGKPALTGLGQLKLKRAKAEEGGRRKRRLLMRTDGGGNVVLNMALSKTFNPSFESNTIRFLGFDQNGKPKTYILRVKTAEMATNLVEAIQEEIEDLKKE